MTSGKATTVKEYLAALADDRRPTIVKLRQIIRKNLPKGYRESVNWGMLSYEVPLDRFPKTYNGQPLMYMALHAQKNHYALYLMNVYGNPTVEKWFRDSFKKAGKKLDMGKSCVRFRALDDLPLDVIARTVSMTSVDEYLDRYTSIMAKTSRKR